MFLIGGGAGFGNHVCVSVQFFLGCELAWLYVCERFKRDLACACVVRHLGICLFVEDTKWQMGLEVMLNS